MKISSPSTVSATSLNVTGTVGPVGAGPKLVVVTVLVIVSVESWPETVVVNVVVITLDVGLGGVVVGCSPGVVVVVEPGIVTVTDEEGVVEGLLPSELGD